MRLTHLLLVPCFALLLIYGPLAISSCGSGNPGLYTIELKDSIRTSGATHRQIYWKVEDTARWEATVAAADTIASDSSRIKIRSGGIWYQARIAEDGLRASQHYPGWERQIDTVSLRKSIIRMLDNQRVIVEVPAANIVLGGDSLRIGIIRVLGKAFDWQNFELNHPDYLLLTTAGEDMVPIAIDQDNVGPISRQTVFRVGRKYYVLRSVAEDYSSITVEAMEAARGMPLVAELDTYYKQIPVKDLDGNPTTVKRTPGRDLAAYFFTLGGYIPQKILRLDSLYKALPESKKNDVDIALISRYDLPDSLRAFIARHDIQFPIYQSTEKTCLRLNCNAYLPYFIAVNETGRIVSYHGWHGSLERKLGVVEDEAF